MVAKILQVGVEVGKKTLDEVKRELAEEVRGLKTPLLIIMGDLDRLTPKEVQEMFQLVKANADFPNLVYLVLFERGAVEKNIEKVLQLNGRDYLEKIVQVGFDVPAIERPRLHKILLEGLERMLADGATSKRFDEQRWGNLFFGGLQGYFKTLRDVNRFLSTLSFHISLFRGEGAFEVNPVDPIGIEVLRVFEPESYRALPANKEVLTRGRDWWRSREDEKRRMIESIVERAPVENRESVRSSIWPRPSKKSGTISTGEKT